MQSFIEKSSQRQSALQLHGPSLFQLKTVSTPKLNDVLTCMPAADLSSGIVRRAEASAVEELLANREVAAVVLPDGVSAPGFENPLSPSDETEFADLVELMLGPNRKVTRPSIRRNKTKRELLERMVTCWEGSREFCTRRRMTVSAYIRAVRARCASRGSSAPLNVIDFDTSDCPNLKFEVPSFIRDLSLGHRYRQQMPYNAPTTSVENYLVISMAGSLTGWHVDFSSTSVFYVLLRGSKEFFLISGSPKNVELRRSFLQFGKR